MSHLSPETLARLLDEVPTPDEATHLATCADCASELDLIRATTEALGRLPDVRPPRGDWDVLEARLASEGLVRKEGGFRSTLARTPGWMKGAAAVLLFVSGTGFGIGLGRVAAPAGAAGSGTAGAHLVHAEPTTVAEAAEAMHQAERVFVDALVRYRQLADLEGEADGVGDAQRRYAALEYFLAAGEAAVREAPADPFMNGLLASVRAERQAARTMVLREASRLQDWY